MGLDFSHSVVEHSGTALPEPSWRSHRECSAGPGLKAPPTRSMGKARVARLGLRGSMMGTLGLKATWASLRLKERLNLGAEMRKCRCLLLTNVSNANRESGAVLALRLPWLESSTMAHAYSPRWGEFETQSAKKQNTNRTSGFVGCEASSLF